VPPILRAVSHLSGMKILEREGLGGSAGARGVGSATVAGIWTSFRSNIKEHAKDQKGNAGGSHKPCKEPLVKVKPQGT